MLVAALSTPIIQFCDEARLRLARGTQQLLHLAYGRAAWQLGHPADVGGLAPDGVLRPVSKAGQSRAVGANRTDDH